MFKSYGSGRAGSRESLQDLNEPHDAVGVKETGGLGAHLVRRTCHQPELPASPNCLRASLVLEVGQQTPSSFFQLTFKYAFSIRILIFIVRKLATCFVLFEL